jgi:hypothetical protein
MKSVSATAPHGFHRFCRQVDAFSCRAESTVMADPMREALPRAESHQAQRVTVASILAGRVGAPPVTEVELLAAREAGRS